MYLSSEAIFLLQQRFFQKSITECGNHQRRSERNEQGEGIGMAGREPVCQVCIEVVQQIVLREGG